MRNRNGVIGAIAVVAAILYLSLYPFLRRHALHQLGPLDDLLRTWDRWPDSGGDFFANILLYLPLGFFAVQVPTHRVPVVLRLLCALVFAAALSVAMELSQYYIAFRFSDMRDVYANVLGACAGAVLGLLLAERWRVPGLAQVQRQPFAALLVGLYLAVRLYPYVPVINPQKYRAALEPLFDFRLPGLTELFLHGATWLVLAHLLERLFGWRAALSLFLLLAALVFGGHILIVDQRLYPGNIVSAAIAFLAWAVLRALPARAAILALALTAAVVIERLAPFRFSPYAHRFEWMPFLPLLHTSTEIGLVGTLAKLFLYGSLIQLALEAGLPLWRAVFALALLLLLCAVLEMFMPGRIAGISDAVLALLIGTALQLLEDRPARPHAA